MNRQIQILAANCKGCVKSGRNLKSTFPEGRVTKLNLLKEPNQELLNFLDQLPPIWGANKFLFGCIDRFLEFSLMQITTRTTATVIKDILENYIALYAIPRAIRKNQGSGFIAK